MTHRKFRIIKRNEMWYLQELLEYNWFMFKTKKYTNIALSVSGSDSLKRLAEELQIEDTVIWESN